MGITNSSGSSSNRTLESLFDFSLSDPIAFEHFCEKLGKPFGDTKVTIVVGWGKRGSALACGVARGIRRSMLRSDVDHDSFESRADGSKDEDGPKKTRISDREVLLVGEHLGPDNLATVRCLVGWLEANGSTAVSIAVLEHVYVQKDDGALLVGGKRILVEALHKRNPKSGDE